MIQRIFSIAILLLIPFALSSCKDVREITYPNGKVHFSVQYIENLKEGTETEFFESGKVKGTKIFSKGKEQGEAKEFYESGNVKATIPYKNGAIEGTVTRYYENGRTESNTLYEKGRIAAFPETFDINGNPQIQGSYKDPRDGVPYEWVRIGAKVWTAENLKYAPVKGSLCMQCNVWGRLYNFETAKSACPTSFHLPSIADWTKLAKDAGKDPAKKLKANFGWNDDGNGTDEFAFAVRASGAHFAAADVPTQKRKFKDAGEKAYFWTSEGNVAVFKKNSSSISFEAFHPDFGASLRCILSR